MTIRRGQPWGEPAQAGLELRVVPTDRDAREWVVAQRERGVDPLPVGLGGGDLARTVGGGVPGRFQGTVMTAPIDVLRVEAGGRTTWAVAHVVARRSWWRGEVLLAMNAQFLDGYDVAPRSHPNDGKVDVVRVAAEMPLRARLQARTRARTGTHLPHPKLIVTQTALHEASFARPLVLWVDGVRWAVVDSVRIIVEPDALTIFA